MDDDTNQNYIEWDSKNAPSMTPTNNIYHPNQLRPCQIVHRIERTLADDPGTEHAVAVYQVQMMDVPYIVHNVPRHMITFRDIPYTQDQYLKHVFRHEIQLPDDVFPHHWKDLL